MKIIILYNRNIHTHTSTRLYAPDNCPSVPYKASAVGLVFILFFYLNLNVRRGKNGIHLVVDATRPLKDIRKKKSLNTFNSLPVSRYAPLPNEVLSHDHGGDSIVVDIRVFLSDDFIDDLCYECASRSKVANTSLRSVFSMRGTEKIYFIEKCLKSCGNKIIDDSYTHGTCFF